MINKRTGKKKTASASKVASRAKAATPTLADLRRIARAIVTSTSVDDEKRMMSLYADGIESEEVPRNEITRGIEKLRRKSAEWSAHLSSAEWIVRNLWCDGQTVVIEWEAHLSLKRGGRKVRHREVAIHEIRNGKIARERHYYDPAPLG